jgi:hypothetical protein
VGEDSRPGRVTYYIDASIPRPVRRAIADTRDDVLYAGGPLAPPENARDEVWLPVAGQGDWIVLMRDKRIRTRRRQRQALIDAKVRAFCFTDAGNATRWQVLALVVARWDDIAETAAAEPGPYIYAVTRTRFEPLAMLGA